MTQKEIDIIINDPDICDMFHYIYCLVHAPQQFTNVPSIASEKRDVMKSILVSIKDKK